MLRRIGSAVFAFQELIFQNCQQSCYKSTQATFARFNSTRTTVRPDEIKLFGELSKKWWDNAIALRNLNEMRVPFARDSILFSKGVSSQVKQSARPLVGYKIADIGCGAGIFSESLARVGADVTGIDASTEMIDAAREHAKLDKSLSENLSYLNTTVEELVKERANYFDALVCSEVIEHVDNPNYFVENCVKLLKPNGTLVFTTINKTWSAAFYVTFWLEYVVRYIPIGTHHYRLLMHPDRLKQILSSNGCSVKTIKGMNLTSGRRWKWINSTRFWYALHAIKNS